MSWKGSFFEVNKRKLEVLKRRNIHSGLRLLDIVFRRKLRWFSLRKIRSIRRLKKKIPKPPSFGNLF